MPTQLAALLPLLGIVSGPPTTHLAHGAAATFGPKLAREYENLFNDMDLVRAGKFGYTRDPLRNAHLKEDRQPQTASQKVLKAERHSVAAAGNSLEIGLFTAMREHMRPAIDTDKLRGKPPAEFSKAYAAALRHAPKSRAIIWEYAVNHAPKDGLFNPEDPLRADHSAKLARFGDQVFNLAKHGPTSLAKDGFDIYAAPIRFEHKACLSCHPRVKVGDVAAVMAFAFRKGT
ncbi:MAG TPA: hypothetical protein VKT78_20835 [Fimbriimonadaceae bacterium]|nr:hypothetical protein [Fimbriimonadaceae bacterium]